MAMDQHNHTCKECDRDREPNSFWCQPCGAGIMAEAAATGGY